MEIGSVIREKRTAQGLTQEQVATALGVSAPAVSKWERGESFPEITLLPALARLLGTFQFFMFLYLCFLWIFRIHCINY